MRNNILIFTSILLLLAIAGCSSSDPNYGPSSLIASWQRTHQADTLYLNITDNSNYTSGKVHSGLKTQLVKGSYNYTDKEVTIYDVSGTGANCPSMPGIYNYFIYADTLILSSVSDYCRESDSSRRSDAIAGSWIRH